MKKIFIFTLLAGLHFFIYAEGNPDPPKQAEGTYTLVVEGFDWGAAASKVILPVEKEVSEVNGGDYTVRVKKSTACMELPPAEAETPLSVCA